MSDDGLIVLRTVRNLLAGNGPVFNAGERVEANTSTLWQYLIYLVALLTNARLEMIAMWLALIFTTVALAIAAWSTSLLFRRRHALVLMPVGGLVYLALPPARDFATSGLEWGLSLLWIAVLWWLLVRWSKGQPSVGKHHSSSVVDSAALSLAVWCGVSWLVRPELALYGGLAGLLILVAAASWRERWLILAVALPLPAAYQLFRMGYYGLITPHTAVAKSAGEAAWADGWGYLMDFVGPYWLWMALILVLAMAVVAYRSFIAAPADSAIASDLPRTNADWKQRLRTPRSVIVLVLVAGFLHLIYVLRVGGDFMHGRMLLLPLFSMLLPVAVLPVIDLLRTSKAHDSLLLIGAVLISWWATSTAIQGHPQDWETVYEQDLGIVDERDFWTYATFREQGNPPLVTEDFATTRVMNDYVEVLDQAVDEDAALVSQFVVARDPMELSWITSPRIQTEELSGIDTFPTTAYHLNLGMTSMNAPLEVRVLDTVGLTTPLAARQPRDPDARVGHDKSLPYSWQAADTAIDLGALPPWYDAEETAQARSALQTPALVELFATYREPMSLGRFIANIKFSLTDGRTLEIALDPAEVIEDQGPVAPDARITWPVEINPDRAR
ncbi:hypothetical protein C5L39_01060 [Corynebacterium alimapuense]|uniref:Terminal beta-(1->2)-arabinofuranosyltransferase C-terminal domain-containing protein n=2 Tax=Corynebacterium alimapuense TaxID=1576874 RepID=A0A3M8KA83_9CORY|nr:hypothetical protein C5L39_01060 [Corynebacterium alimapuense]